MRVILIIIKILFICQVGFVQIEYSGIVQDIRGEALIGANILSVDELKGWLTNFYGEFEFSAPKDLEVYVTYTGYERLKIVLKPRDTIILKTDDYDGSPVRVPLHSYKKHYSSIRYPRFYSKEDFRLQKIENHRINSIGTLASGKQYHSYELLTEIVSYQSDYNIVELIRDSTNLDQWLVLNEIENDEVLVFKEIIPIDALKNGIYDVYCLDEEEFITADKDVFEIHTIKSTVGVILKGR